MSKQIVTIHWQIDREKDTPAYIQIADYFTSKIQSGDWAMGSYLPNQRTLAKLLGVNRSTVVTALDELKSLGFVETHGKGGTQIASCAMPTYIKKSPDWSSHIAEGFHFSNLETIQVINKCEFSEGYIRLSSGEPSPDMFPKTYMTEVMSELGTEMSQLGYEAPKGMPYLREQVCAYVKEFGIDTQPENVLIVSGALQAIQLISMGLLQPGSSIFLEKPSYLYSLNIFQSIGMRRTAVPMDSFGIVPEMIEKLRPKHRQSLLYTVPNFHNPTGITMPQHRREKLLEVCSKHMIPIIEDDVYRDLWLDTPPPDPIKSMDAHGNVLYVGSVSKTLSTGLRIGWLIGPESVVERLGDLKMQNDYGSSSLSQLVAGKFLEKGFYKSHGEAVRGQLFERRKIAADALKLYFSDLATYDFPTGGYYFWLTLNDSVKMPELFEAAFRQGILMYPGYLYDNAMNQCLRLSYSYASPEELVYGIQKLSELVRHSMIKK